MDNCLNYMRRRNGQPFVDGLRDMIAELPPGLVMAEIGVYAGESTREFMASGKVNLLIAVDPWVEYQQLDGWISPYPWAEVRATFERWARTQPIVICPVASAAAAAFIADNALDFVYIDANHDGPAIQADLAAWLPKVRPGGYLGGHDYSIQPFPGLVQAVNELCGGWDRVRRFADTSWLWRKPEGGQE